MSRFPLFRAMEAFEAVVRLGSLAAAGGELGISSGAVSQQVRRLEDHLGVSLLERRGRGLVPTRWGLIYRTGLAAGFDALDAAGHDLAQARHGQALVVSGLPTVVTKWLGRAVHGWSAAHPGHPVHLIAEDAEPELDTGAADFRMSYGPGTGTLPLFTDEVVPACAPALAAGLRQPQDLWHLPLIDILWSARYLRLDPPGWASWARAHGLPAPTRPPVLRFAQTAPAIDAAAAGRGLVLGQRAMMTEELREGRLTLPFDLAQPMAHAYRLGWAQGALDKPGARAFRDWLVALARRQTAGDGAPV
mgnify:CR=1 FL=1